MVFVWQAVIHILGQQQGLPVTYLCRIICDSAWHKYVVLQKKERGVVEKVSTRLPYYHVTLGLEGEGGREGGIGRGERLMCSSFSTLAKSVLPGHCIETLRKGLSEAVVSTDILSSSSIFCP